MNDITMILFVIGTGALIIALICAFHALLLQFHYFQDMPHVRAWIVMTSIGLGVAYLWIRWCVYLCNKCTF